MSIPKYIHEDIYYRFYIDDDLIVAVYKASKEYIPTKIWKILAIEEQHIKVSYTEISNDLQLIKRNSLLYEPIVQAMNERELESAMHEILGDKHG